jgi:hypothetical protein
MTAMQTTASRAGTKQNIGVPQVGDGSNWGQRRPTPGIGQHALASHGLGEGCRRGRELGFGPKPHARRHEADGFGQIAGPIQRLDLGRRWAENCGSSDKSSRFDGLLHRPAA